MVFAYFSRGDNAQAANHVKIAQILEFTDTRFARHLSLLPTSIWSPTSRGRLDGCRFLATRPTLSCQKWGTHALQVVGESSILLSSQTLCNLSGGESHLEYNTPCKPHIDKCFQEFMQTAEECVAEAHGQAEQERGTFFGRAAGVKFR